MIRYSSRHIIILFTCDNLVSDTQATSVMELSLFSAFLMFLIPFAYLSLHKLNRKKKFDAAAIRLPPGTSGLPFIGETLSFYLKIRKGVQFEFISDRMSKYSSNVFRTSLMGEQVAIISSAEGNKFMFCNENKLVQLWFPSRVEKFFPKSDKQPPSVHGKRVRNIIVPWVLKINGLQDCVGLMNTVMKQHLKAYWTCKNDQEMVIKGAEMAKRYALALGCNLFLGICDLSVIETFVKGIDDIESAFIAFPINLPGTTWNRGIKASRVLRAKLEAIIRKKKMQMLKLGTDSTEKDFIAGMILAKDEDGELMTIEDMASHLVGLLEAGYLTLQTTITMLLKSLAENPHVYDCVLQEHMAIASSKQAGEGIKWEDFEKMKYSWNVIREVLRLYSPGVGGFKEAITDLIYEGYTIPKGWKIYWLSQSTHMNPKYFPDPEKFDPSRFDGEGPIPYTFVPFGSGLRMCPGYKFAKLATLTFLHYVVTKFGWEKVNPHEKILYDFVPSSAEGLAIRLHYHKN